MATMSDRKSGSIRIRYFDPVDHKQKTVNIQFTGSRTDTRRLAQAKKLEIEHQISLHKSGLKSFSLCERRDDNIERLTLGDFYLKIANDESRKIAVDRGTMAANLIALQNLIKVIGPEIPLIRLALEPSYMHQFTKQRFNQGIQRYEEKGLEIDEDKIKRGINVNLKDLSAVFNYAVGAGYIPEHFVPKLHKFKTKKRLPVILEHDEIIKIMKALDESNGKSNSTLDRGDAWLAYVIIKETGLRRAAIVRKKLNSTNGLKWKDINWMRNELRTEIKGKEYNLPMSDFLKKTLLQRKQELDNKWNPALFVIKYTAPTITHYFKRAMRTAGIEKPGSVHILRHTLPMKLLEHGATTSDIKEWLNHSDIRATDIYVHVRSERLHKLAKLMDKTI